MDGQADILFTLLEYGWVGLVGIIVWLFKKISAIEANLQERRGIVNTAVAVLQKSQDDLRNEFNKETQQNTVAHQAILDRIDANHNSMMTRFDKLISVVRNGH
jgi:hypothetical protein